MPQKKKTTLKFVLLCNVIQGPRQSGDPDSDSGQKEAGGSCQGKRRTHVKQYGCFRGE